MPRVNLLDDKRRAKLIGLLAEGNWLSDALVAIGVSRRTLHRAELEDARFRTEVKQAIAGGIRYKIDEAAQAVSAAQTRDQSICARHAMEATEKRAKLLAPATYAPKDTALPPLPTGTEGMLMVRWQTADPQANTNAQQPSILDHEPSQAIDSKPALKAIDNAA